MSNTTTLKPSHLFIEKAFHTASLHSFRVSECIIILTKLSTMQCKNVIRRFSCNKRQIWYAVIDTCNFNYFLINCAALI